MYWNLKWTLNLHFQKIHLNANFSNFTNHRHNTQWDIICSILFIWVNSCQWDDVRLFVCNTIRYQYTQRTGKLLHRNCVQWHIISSLASTFHEMATHTIITMIFPNVLRRLMPYAYTLITENRDGFITYIIERFISNFNIIPTSCLPFSLPSAQ